MTERELETYLHKNVRITCIDGDILEGYVFYFADSEDSEPEEAGIILSNEKRLKRDVAVSLSEIKSIDVINN